MTLSVQQQYLEHRIVEAREHPLHDADAVGPASELFERGEGGVVFETVRATCSACLINIQTMSYLVFFYNLRARGERLTEDDDSRG